MEIRIVFVISDKLKYSCHFHFISHLIHHIEKEFFVVENILIFGRGNFVSHDFIECVSACTDIYVRIFRIREENSFHECIVISRFLFDTCWEISFHRESEIESSISNAFQIYTCFNTDSVDRYRFLCCESCCVFFIDLSSFADTDIKRQWRHSFE